MRKATNHFQIIGGTHRGRKLTFPDAPGLRPTPNKVRETLFNWIQFEINNSIFLDLFSGSGSLSFEAISRGAKKVISIEKNTQAFKCLINNQQKLNIENINIINNNALTFLKQKPIEKFDFVLLDPPFNKNILPKTLTELSKNGFIASRSKVYIESEFEIKQKFLDEIFLQKTNISKQKTSGQVHYCLIEVL